MCCKKTWRQLKFRSSLNRGHEATRVEVVKETKQESIFVSNQSSRDASPSMTSTSTSTMRIRSSKGKSIVGCPCNWAHFPRWTMIYVFNRRFLCIRGHVISLTSVYPDLQSAMIRDFRVGRHLYTRTLCRIPLLCLPRLFAARSLPSSGQPPSLWKHRWGLNMGPPFLSTPGGTSSETRKTLSYRQIALYSI